MNEKGVSNNAYWRGKSNGIDNFFGWNGGYGQTSGTRGFVHGVYHTGVGVGKAFNGNFQGSGAELSRAGQQFARTGSAIGSGVAAGFQYYGFIPASEMP